MGFIFGLLARLIKWTLYFLIFAALIVLIPNLPPYSKFSSVELEPGLPRTGPLSPNEALNNAKQLYQDKLLGPEAFQLYNGEVYTSLATGEIVKLSPGGHVTFVTKIGSPCVGLVEEDKCGRPLDFKIDEKQKKLYVADAYHGIWKVDLGTDKKQLLVSPRVEIEGRTPKVFNSLALAPNGDFYWTDSCSEFTLKDGALCTLSNPSGRLFHYDAAKNSSKVLVDDLWFANGVVLSPDQQFVLVAETSRFRLMKHYLAGPKKGQTEVFVAGLPGTPDNVRALPDGSGVLVGLFTVYDEQNPLLMRNVATMPSVRKFLARMARLIEIPVEFLNEQFPHIVFQNIVYHIGSFASMSSLLPPISGLVQIDWNGNIVASYYNTDRSLKSISDGIVFNDMLYLGSPTHHNFVGAVPAPELLKQAFKVKQSVQEKKDQPQMKPSEAKPVKAETKPVKSEPVKQKVEEKKEAPKAATPPVKVAPKPSQQTRPPTTTPKPTEAPKPTTTKSPENPKQEQAKPESKLKVEATTPKPAPKAEAKPTQPPPAEAKPTQPPQAKQPNAKPAASPPVENKPKAAEKKPSQKADSASNTKQQDSKSAKEQIPIIEEIPSDTIKPSKETLKVIKKEGPAEIPNPVV